MKKVLALVLTLMVSLVGCCSVVVTETPEVVSRLELGRAIARHLGVGIVISIEKEVYQIIPSQSLHILLEEFYPSKSSSLDVAVEFKTLCQLITATGAVGIALLGPPNDSKYWVVYLNEARNLYLVDPIAKDVILWDWIQNEGAWVSF